MFGALTSFFTPNREYPDGSSSSTPLPPSPCESGETPLSSAATPGPRSATPASPGVSSTPRSFLPFFRQKDPTLVCPKPQKMPRLDDIASVVAEVFRKAGNIPEHGIDLNGLKRKTRYILKEDGSTEQREFYVYKKTPLAPSSEVFAFVAVELKPNGSTENFVYSKLKAATKQFDPSIDRSKREEIKSRYEAAIPFYLRASSLGIGPETLKFQKREGQPKPYQTLSRLANRGDFITLGSLRLANEIEVSDENIFNFGREIIQKLLRLHSMHVSHGDLKPENVLFHQEEDKWESFICDYGFAKDLTHAPSVGRIDSGTPEYLPPELDFQRLTQKIAFNIKNYVVESKADRFKADCYALGLTLFTILANNSFRHDFEKFIHKKVKMNCSQALSKESLQQLAQILNVGVDPLSSVPLARIFRLEFTLDQTVAIRTLLLEAYIDENLKPHFPSKAEVIKGLLKQNPDERWSLERALEEWVKG